MTVVDDVLRGRLEKVKESGSHNLKALCPFHDETSPSFCVDRMTGMYICFSCGAKGSLQTLLRHLGVKGDVIKEVEADLEPVVRRKIKKREQAQDEVLIPEAVLGIFEFCPTVLLEAGFDEEVLWTNEIGYDKKRKRVTFPVRSVEGHLVGIVGRQSSGKGTRYIGYTSDELGVPTKFSKSHLWHLHKIVRFAYSTVVLVEGFKACMWVQQTCYDNCVAQMGTHLTNAQRRLLSEHFDTVILLGDDDDPGREGVYRIASDLQDKTALRVKACMYPDHLQGKSPDDLSHDDVGALVEDAKTFNRNKWKELLA